MTMNREMTDIKIEPDGLLIPPQYLDGLGPTAIVRRIKGGLIVESRDQAQAREELRALVERIRAAVKSDAPERRGDWSHRRRGSYRACASSLTPTSSSPG
jgi:hypothetical protein